MLSTSLILLYTTLGEKSILNLILWHNIFRGDIMRPLKQKISITIDEDILEKVKILAENNDRSLSQYINLVLKEHLKNNKSGIV